MAVCLHAHTALLEMAGRRREENLESKIIIRNYPPDTDDRDLRIMFEKYGKIEDCKWCLQSLSVCDCNKFAML